jgi:hypothetical protein
MTKSPEEYFLQRVCEKWKSLFQTTPGFLPPDPTPTEQRLRPRQVHDHFEEVFGLNPTSNLDKWIEHIDACLTHPTPERVTRTYGQGEYCYEVRGPGRLTLEEQEDLKRTYEAAGWKRVHVWSSPHLPHESPENDKATWSISMSVERPPVLKKSSVQLA